MDALRQAMPRARGEAVLAHGQRTRDIGGTAGAKDVGAAVAAQLCSIGAGA